MSKFDEMNNEIKTKRTVEIPLGKFLDWCDVRSYETLMSMIRKQLAENEIPRKIRVIFEVIDETEYNKLWELNRETITKEARKKEREKFFGTELCEGTK